MKTAKELFERLKNDDVFAKEFAEAFNAKREAGASVDYSTSIRLAEEFGYSVSKEAIDEYIGSQDYELSEEELDLFTGRRAFRRRVRKSRGRYVLPDNCRLCFSSLMMTLWKETMMISPKYIYEL